MAVRKLILLAGLAAIALPLAADETATEAEIEYLMSEIGASGCTFIRNGKRHDAQDAESHIRMKYRRASRHAKTAEMFIERLASKSSMSRKPYLMDCPGEDVMPSGDWLNTKLAEYRDTAEQNS